MQTNQLEAQHRTVPTSGTRPLPDGEELVNVRASQESLSAARPGKSEPPPVAHATEQVAPPAFSHRLVGPILKYLEGRGQLLTIEAREALQQVAGLVIWLAIAVVAVFAGWLLLATTLVGVLAGYLGWSWVTATAVAGAAHILIALAAGLVMRKRLTTVCWFADSLNELKNDSAWLKTRTTKN
jgi:uncharacterized membrane protein YqjE